MCDDVVVTVDDVIFGDVVNVPVDDDVDVANFVDDDVLLFSCVHPVRE